MPDDKDIIKDTIEIKANHSTSEISEVHKSHSCRDGFSDKNLKQKIESYLESRGFHIFVLTLTILDMVTVAMILTVPELAFQNDPTSKEKFVFGLHVSSTIILGIFLVEVLTKMIVYQKRFCKKPLELFDAGVIISSLTLDIINMIPVFEIPAVEFLIIGRLWRVAVLVNGTFYSINTSKNRMIDKLKKDNATIREENEHLRTRLESLIAESAEVAITSNESVLSLVVV